MKTLDEVIKAFEICIGYYCSNAEHDVCPYLGESDMGCGKEPEKDALHYLKEYRERQENLDQFETYQFEQNRPLTWSELRQMEGKPVWVEINDYVDAKEIGGIDCTTKYEKAEEWMLVRRVFDNLVHLKRANGSIFDARKRLRITAWQAYRKERD